MQIPVNPNITIEAVQLLEYLEKTAGKRIISGQHTQTVDCEEINYIRENTSCEPKLRGFEMLAYSPNINYEDSSKECLKEIEENRDTMEVALSWGISANHIVELTYHWFSPLGGHEKSFYSKNTDFDPEKVLQYGTPERKAFYDDMDSIAVQLRRFQNVHIPVLWRPFHESEGKWFWWGRKGAAVAKELYLLMYDYYVNVHHLNNLLWVWSCPDIEGYPGDDYVDIVGIDVYPEKFKSTDYKEEYEKLIAGTSKNKIAALTEIGFLPNMDMLKESKVPWAYFMTWSKEWIIGDEKNPVDRLKKAYASDYVVSI